ncbi:MAG TPA: cytochrome-c peroxidase [Candidatus Binatia bacterium]|nr:cytochrome-c peroxidase [Candidatus Binatia bacterium]
MTATTGRRHALLLVVTLIAARAPAAEPTRPKGETLRSGSFVLELPLGLQAGAAYLPDDNPLSADKIALGKLLYFDPRLSKDGTISCASCHIPFHGFADPHRTSAGVGRQEGTRNSPTVINRLFAKEQFWDGRAADLEDQAKGPMVNPVEMAMASHDVVVQRVRGVKGYAPLFEKAFGTGEITIDRVTKAIACYERTVLSGDSPYDRYQAGDKDALSPAAVRGAALFDGKANCRTCHTGFNFTDESYHNLGVGMSGPKPDLGRYVVTKVDTDRGAFKTPTLRNVIQTAPYMHDGSESTLREVVEFYNRGGNKNPWLSKEIKPLGLAPRDVDDLVAFLESLTGDVSDLEPPTALPQ